MPQRLTRADVDRIAGLARLALTEVDKDLFVRQLADVLEYADQIQAVDTSGIPPTAQVLSQHPTDRADEPRPGLSNAEALSNAPDASPATGFFAVPRVLG